jgi:hypothetical protein
MNERIGLYGSNDVESVGIDSIYEALVDIRTLFMNARIRDGVISVDEMTTKKGAVHNFFINIWPSWAKKLTAILTANNGSEWFVGNKLSLADIAVYYILTGVTAAAPTSAAHDTLRASVAAYPSYVFALCDYYSDALAAYPLLSEHSKRVAAFPPIAAWIAKRPVTPW